MREELVPYLQQFLGSDVALVSPTDLAKACAMFPKLRLPVRVKTFKSGLVVVMDASATEEVIERNLLKYIIGLERGVTALEVGAKFNWGVGVAMELLLVRIHLSFG